MSHFKAKMHQIRFPASIRLSLRWSFTFKTLGQETRWAYTTALQALSGQAQRHKRLVKIGTHTRLRKKTILTAKTVTSVRNH